MNYQKIYNNLVDRGVERILDKSTYTERHHIIPKCMGGDNGVDNLVKLTAREHFIAHSLLVKIYPDNSKLTYALFLMYGRFKNRTNGKTYELLRIKAIEIISKHNTGRVVSIEGRLLRSEVTTNYFKTEEGLIQKEFLRNLNLGKKHSKESIARMCIANKGRIPSEETKSKLSNIKLEYWKSPESNSHKENISTNRLGDKNPISGINHTKASLEKISNASKTYWNSPAGMARRIKTKIKTKEINDLSI